MGNLNYPDKSYFFGYQGKAKILTFPMMNQTLAKYSKDGFLTLQNFNDCLSVLTFDENFPRLAYTYLSERLFNLIDSSNTGRIENDKFMKGMCMVLSCQETKIHSKKTYFTYFIYSIV